MTELHPIGWYARKVSPNLPREAFKPVSARLWGGLIYLLIAVAGIGTIGVLNLPWYLNLGIALIIGQALGGMGFLAHEVLHNTVVKSSLLRDVLGGIGFSPFFLGPKLWRRWHNMEHHAHTQQDDLDPDAWATMDELFKRPIMRHIYRLPSWVRNAFTFLSYTLFFSIHSLLMLKRFYPGFKPKERRVVIAQLIAPLAFWVALLVWMGPTKWLFAYVIPLLITNFLVIGYISTNHQLNPITDVNDPLANSLSVTVPRWVDVLHFNFSYHTEHHLFPGVNPKWGPAIKAETKRLFPEQYHEMPMTQAMVALWKTPRIYKDEHNLVDPYKDMVYGSLGHGLDPANIQPRPAVQSAANETAAPANENGGALGFNIFPKNATQGND